MEKSSVEAIVHVLNEAGVRYLIVGGMAVVAHGYVRFTADLDLVLDLREDNLRRMVAALAGQGYRPRAPEAYTEASTLELGPGLSATFVSYHRLLEMKKQAGRPKDLEDVVRLQALRGE